VVYHLEASPPAAADHDASDSSLLETPGWLVALWLWTALSALQRGLRGLSALSADCCRGAGAGGGAGGGAGSGPIEFERLLMVLASALQLATNVADVVARASAGSGDAAAEVEPSVDSPAFQLRMLHAVAILVLFLHATSFSFRGFLRFGALQHLVLTVLQDIGPFLVLLVIVLVAFSMALGLVVTDIAAELNTLRYHLFSAFATTLDMGLYGAAIEPAVVHHQGVLLLYVPFMLLVQVTLLNLLIAIMTDSHNRMGTSAKLVARYQRAKLVLNLEPTPSADASGSRWYHGTLRRCSAALFRGQPAENPRPRWLHVLTPPEHDMHTLDSSDGSNVEKQLAALTRAFTAYQETVTQQLDALAAAQKKADPRLAAP